MIYRILHKHMITLFLFCFISSELLAINNQDIQNSSEGSVILARQKMYFDKDWSKAKTLLKFALLCDPKNQTAQKLLKQCHKKQSPQSCPETLVDKGRQLAVYLSEKKSSLAEYLHKDQTLFAMVALTIDPNCFKAKEILRTSGTTFSNESLSEALNSRYDTNILLGNISDLTINYFQYPENSPDIAIRQLNKYTSRKGISVSFKENVFEKPKSLHKNIQFRNKSAVFILNYLDYSLNGIFYYPDEKPGFIFRKGTDQDIKVHDYLKGPTLISECTERPKYWLGKTVQVKTSIKSAKLNSTVKLTLADGIFLHIPSERLRKEAKDTIRQAGTEIIIRAKIKDIRGDKVLLNDCHNIFADSQFLLHF